MKIRLLASFMALALPLALTAVAPAFADEDGTSHEDGNVFHDRSYGRHVDHEYGPNGEHIDHDYTNGRHVDRVYRYPDRDAYSYAGRDRGSYRGYYGYGRYDRDRDYNEFSNSCDDRYYPEPAHAYRTHHRSWWGGW